MCFAYYKEPGAFADDTPVPMPMLAGHLGHSLDIHRSHYCLQKPIINMCKLSRPMAAESWKPAQFVA